MPAVKTIKVFLQPVGDTKHCFKKQFRFKPYFFPKFQSPLYVKYNEYE